jgi:hypothetical protein
MNRTRNYLVGSVLAAVAVGASLALFASSAGAAPAATVNASTQIQGAPDTSVSPTGLCEAANGSVVSDQLGLCIFGPVWATDTYIDKFQIKALGGGCYSVQRQANGTFTAFAQPNSGLSAPVLIVPSVTGKFHGTISYTVCSSQGPIGTLPAKESIGTTGGSTVLYQIFGNTATITGGNDWVFAYSTATSRMVQAWNTDSSTWGNITG